VLRSAAAAVGWFAAWFVLGGCPSTTDDPCAGVACSSRGFCIEEQDTAYCACLADYHPEALECLPNDEHDACLGITCTDHGTCVFRLRGPECDCDPGYHHPADYELQCAPDVPCDARVEDQCSEPEAEAEAEVLVPECGNGTPEGTEECDDGNAVPGDGCEDDCRFSCHVAADCADTDPCTLDECLEGGTGWTCERSIDAGAACDDGQPCTYDDRCQGDGSCLGTAISCTSETCIARSCNGTSSCAVTFHGGDVGCEDGNPCTVNVCNGAGGCGTAYNVGDGTAPDGGQPQLRCCGGWLVDIWSNQGHCGGCFISCEDRACIAFTTSGGIATAACYCAASNAQCQINGANWTCYNSPDWRCNCQEDSDCAAGQLCDEPSGHNGCYYP
jgi:cysteine-rich repeat protein